MVGGSPRPGICNLWSSPRVPNPAPGGLLVLENLATSNSPEPVNQGVQDNLKTTDDIRQSLQDSAIAEFIAKSSKLRNISQIFIIAADSPQILGLDVSRDVTATRIQSKKGGFSVKKIGMNSFAFSSWSIYKSYIGQLNRKRNEPALLIWATRRRSFIWSGQTAGSSRSRDTVIHSAGRYSEDVVYLKTETKPFAQNAYLLHFLEGHLSSLHSSLTQESPKPCKFNFKKTCSY